MMEIERKFLVKSNAYREKAFKQERIVQGFLNSHKERTVRVRIKQDKGYLTIKGISSKDGTSRFEWEKEIDKHDAEALLKLCEDGILSKTRYEVKFDEYTFEVDEFHDENDGLVIAEIELSSVDEEFKKPDWLGKEVTGDIKYYNSQISKNPYSKWKQ